MARIIRSVAFARRTSSRPLLRERAPAVEARVVERSPDRLERHPELATDEDLLQAQEILVVVEAVAVVSTT